MSKKSQFNNGHKRFSIVHKPFLTGQINLFNPPKKNPNGNLASAKLWQAHTLDYLKEEESVTEKANEPQTIIEPTNVNVFFNGWKLTAIGLIILANLIASIVLIWQKQKAPSVLPLVDNNQQLYVSGKTDLTGKEFITLNINNLKNVERNLQHEAIKPTNNNLANQLENLPLAIPPTNLPQDIIIPQAQSKSQYYYILAAYTGDRSLELAKTKVPHVSLVNFPQGIFIYMGAFTEKESARTFIKQLQELGLEGYLYPFD